MKIVAFDGNGGEFLIRDLDSQGIGIFIQGGLDTQSGLSGRATNQVDHDLPADQGTTTPVGRDVTEQAMFDLVPLTGSRRAVTDLESQPQFIGQFLQFPSPPAHPVTMAAATVGGNQQAAWVRITAAPIARHQRRMLSTANSAVS